MSESSCSKGSTYFTGRRSSIAEYVQEGPHRVLDVGCGAGVFGSHLIKTRRARHVTGIEINQEVAEQAQQILNAVHCVNLDLTPISDILDASDRASFDYIVCNDVLEHLVDPWQVLAELVLFLTASGTLIISIPNVRHWSVCAPLVFCGRWDYKSAGIMDRTHLRFFTRRTAVDLITGAGLQIEQVQPLIGGHWKTLARASLGILDEFLAIQWVLVCRRQ